MTSIQTHSRLTSTPIMDQLMIVKALNDGVDFKKILERAFLHKQQEFQADSVQLEDRLLYKVAQTKENNLRVVKDIAEANLFEDANIKKQKIQEALDEGKLVVTELKEKVEVSTRELSEKKRDTAFLIDQLKTFNIEINKGNDNSFQEPLNKIGNQLCHYINKNGNNL